MLLSYFAILLGILLVSITVKVSNTGNPSLRHSKNFAVRGKRPFCVVLKSRAGRIHNLLKMRKY